MLQSLIEWLTGGLASVIDIIISMFLNALEPSLSNFIETFPSFAAAYNVFKVIGAGLAVTIAAVGMFSFFRGSGSPSSMETPWQILGRAAIAGALIVGGGYILSYMVEVAKFSYDVFFNMDYQATGGDGLGELLLGTGKKYASTIFSNGISMGVTAFAAADGSLVEDLIVSDLAISLLILFLDIAVGWELFKVMVEVAERYLMVGVLVYTSPLVFSTVASGQTAGVFKRWCGMFISSLLLMSLSVFFLNASIAALASIGADDSFIVSLVLILAMLKIAQRLDTYMSQLGLNAAQTGGSLLDTIFAGAKTIGNFAKGAFGGRSSNGGGEGSKSGGSVLGRALGATTVGKYARVARSAGESILNGEGLKGAAETAKAARKDEFQKSVMGGFKDKGVSGAVNNAKDTMGYIMTGTRPSEVEAAKKAQEEAKKNAHISTSPEDKAAAAKASADRSAPTIGAETAEAVQARQGVNPGEGVPNAEFVDKVAAGQATPEEMAQSFKENGIEEIRAGGVEKTGNGAGTDDRFVMKADKDGNLALSDAAVAAGLRMETGENGEAYVTGPTEALQDYMDKSTTADKFNSDANGDRIAAKSTVTAADAAQDLGLNNYDTPAADREGHYYKNAQAELRSDNSEFSSGRTYAETEKNAYDANAVKAGGYYYNAAEDQLRTSGENADHAAITSMASTLQSADREKVESATVSAATAARDSTMSAVQDHLEQMRSDVGDTAREMPELTANTIRRDTSGQLSRNVFATTSIPDGTKEYGSTNGDTLFDRAFGSSVTDKAGDSGFRNVRIEENDGSSGHKGRCVSAEYTNSDGQAVRVSMYDQLSKINGAVPDGFTQIDYTGAGYHTSSPISRSFFMVSTPVAEAPSSPVQPISQSAATQPAASAFNATPSQSQTIIIQQNTGHDDSHDRHGGNGRSDHIIPDRRDNDTGYETSPVTPKLSNGTRRVTSGSSRKDTVKRNSKNKPSGPPT